MWLKAVCIGTCKQRNGATSMLNLRYGKPRQGGATLAKRTSTSEKQLEEATLAEKNATLTTTADADVRIHQEHRLHAKKAVDDAKKSQAAYHEHLQGISEEIHPFSLTDNTINEAKTVEAGLENRAQAFEGIGKEQGISDKKNRLKKCRKQIPALANTVSFWWRWVKDILSGLAVDSELENGLKTGLLPVVYWHHQLQKSQNPKTREKYRHAWQQAIHALNASSFSTTLPTSEMQRWLTWAQWTVEQFHRSSSAVEGRNGCLAQLYHTGRGLSKQRLRALTVIHNYGLKREDGTTAAMRLFDTEFTDLFSWLLENMGELPLPRKSRERVILNPLKLIDVPL